MVPWLQPRCPTGCAITWLCATTLLLTALAARPDPLIRADEPQCLSCEQLATAPNTSS